MDSSLQNALQKMGSNFVVAAFVPSLAFILVSALCFFPVLPDELVRYLGWSVTAPSQATLITGLLFTTILGFTLFTLSTYIYKSFEGYTFVLGLNTPIRHAFLQRQKKRSRKIELEKASIAREQKKLNELLAKEKKDSENAWAQRRISRYQTRLEQLKNQHYSLVATAEINFPPSEHLILPSRFGNILRAAEMYPGTRYKIDAVPLWGRMAHVIPPDAMDKIDQANNQCLFLLNSSLLAGIFTVISLIAGLYVSYILTSPVYHWPLLSFMKTTLTFEHVGIYLISAILSSTVAYFFYQASLLNVSQYGSMIRTAYDLYRFDLIKKLHLELPKNLEGERTLWQKISEFFVGGQAFNTLKFDYIFADQANAKAQAVSETGEDVSVDELGDFNATE